MKEKIISYFRLKLISWQSLICAFFVTSIFALRWRNCLPFSGYMPSLNNNIDRLGIWGNALIYNKEPFGFPFGLIQGLSFPFQITYVARGSALFAILFKLLSKIYMPLSEFYYLVLFELLCVFITAYFTYLLLELFKVSSFWLKLLGVVLVSLSFPLFHRSSNYYGLSYQVAYFPIYLAFAYFYMRIYKYPNWKPFFLLVLFFSFAAFFDYYPFFGVCFIFLICLCFNILETLLNNNKANFRRLRFIILAFIVGMSLYFATLFVMGVYGIMKVERGNGSALIGRYDKEWGYGGGYGGGFGVADVLTLVIPPEDNKRLPFWKKCGPSSYLTKIGFPLTTGDLQDGQYEGFSYLGTTTIVILLFLIIANLSLVRNYRKYFMKFKLCIMSQYFIVNNLFSLPIMFGISTFLLYVLSWGYILHIGGVRLNNIATPSLFLAMMLPKFVFVRAMGRLAFPFMLFITIAAVIWLDRFLSNFMPRSNKIIRITLISVIMLLAILHISEISGYLKPPEVTAHNEIADIFGKSDRKLIKELMGDKKAIIVVPALRGESINWTKICYSLAFHSNIPISGTIAGIAVPVKCIRQFNSDINSILAGDIKAIINKYGNIVVATRSTIAEKILMNANMTLKPHKLQDQDVIILTLDR